MGCKNTTSLIVSNTSITTSLDYSHLKEIVDNIKSQINPIMEKDLFLPVFESNKYNLEYKCLGSEIENGYIIYESSPRDFNITLIIKLSSSTLEYSDLVTITNKEDKNYLLKKRLKSLNDELNTFIEYIPDVITKDIDIKNIIDSNNPSFNYNIYINNKLSDGLISYSMPLNNKVYKITLEFYDSYDNKVSIDKEITMLSVDNINEIPRMCLSYDSTKEITKDEYVDGLMSFYIKENNEYKLTYNNKTLGIRGRGNSTWGQPKKPLKLKFDKKISFFNEVENKTWVLLANYMDQSLMRNYLAYNFSKTLSGLDFSPCAYFIELYINDEYNGLYLLSDQIETKKGRVDISEEETSETNTNYLIEINNKLFDYPEGTLNKDYFILEFSQTNQAIEIKTPDTDKDYYSINQLNYIKNYLLEVLTCLKNKGDIYKYIDMDSAVDYFIVEEIFKNVDSGYSSTYLYKKKDGLLYFGPVWDFDLSAGNQGHADNYNRGPEGFYTSLKYRHIFYYYLMKDDRFVSKLKSRWKEIYKTNILSILDNIDATYEYIKGAAYYNFKKWDVIGKDYSWYTAPDTYNTKTYYGQVNLLKEYLIERIKWLNEELK